MLNLTMRITIDGRIELCSRNTSFMSTRFFNASEAIRDVSPTEEGDIAVRIQLNPYRGYLLSPHFQKSGYLDQYTQRFQTFLWGALSDPRQTPPPPNVARIDEPNRKASNRA